MHNNNDMYIDIFKRFISSNALLLNILPLERRVVGPFNKPMNMAIHVAFSILEPPSILPTTKFRNIETKNSHHVENHHKLKLVL